MRGAPDSASMCLKVYMRTILFFVFSSLSYPIFAFDLYSCAISLKSLTTEMRQSVDKLKSLGYTTSVAARLTVHRPALTQQIIDTPVGKELPFKLPPIDKFTAEEIAGGLLPYREKIDGTPLKLYRGLPIPLSEFDPKFAERNRVKFTYFDTSLGEDSPPTMAAERPSSHGEQTYLELQVPHFLVKRRGDNAVILTKDAPDLTPFISSVGMLNRKTKKLKWIKLLPR